MRTIRRTDLSPRVEMIPLIDVIFLLLTFFIYSLMVMVHAQILPVSLTTLGSGERATQPAVHAITLDDQGRLYFNRQPITLGDLERELKALADQPDTATLYLAMQEEGTTDRGPALIRLIEVVRRAGLTDFVIVGQPDR